MSECRSIVVLDNQDPLSLTVLVGSSLALGAGVTISGLMTDVPVLLTFWTALLGGLGLGSLT